MKLILLGIFCHVLAYSAQPCPGPNEIMIPCKNDCINDTCSIFKNPVPCKNPHICLPGCVCQMGYLRKDKSSPCKFFLNCLKDLKPKP